MTRFKQEISGALGAYWKASAEKELEGVRRELENGEITIDENGVARNCIGRVLMSDLLEKVAYITEEVDVAATEAAYEAEVRKDIEEYCKKVKRQTAEEIAEMKAAFGIGTTVVDVLTGEKITLE